jgi:NAD(P)-dependent dehydrogenase (short-subunit alcohol dehydrogenase family)
MSNTCVITGATSGIGRAAAEQLARQGLQVVMVARDEARGASALRQIIETTGNDRVSLELCDLASQPQVRQLADRLMEAHPQIDVLVNNAGLTMAEHVLTDEGFEYTLAVNHLAPFLLTNLLIERLKASAPARVITVSSDAHHGASIPFDNLNGEKGYSGWAVYGWTKLANIVFTNELARRLDGSGVIATCLHPGVVATGFGRTAPLIIKAFQILARPFLLNSEKGADTLVWLASSPEVEGATGGYYVKRQLAKTSPAAQDRQVAKRLWEVSEELCGLGRGV